MTHRYWKVCLTAHLSHLPHHQPSTPKTPQYQRNNAHNPHLLSSAWVNISSGLATGPERRGQGGRKWRRDGKA